MHLRRRSGLTLVEVMIVVVVMGIVAALVVPRAGASDASVLAAAGRVLAADLSFAQSESLAHAGAPRGVRFDTTAQSYTVVQFADAAPHNCTNATALTEPITKTTYTTVFGTGRGSPFARVTLGTLSLGSDACVAFEALGQLDQSTAATVQIRRGTATLTLTIDPDSGEITTGP
jgi:type II secretion system protein H